MRAHKESAADFLGSWTVAEDYSHGIIDDLNANTTAYLDWNMLLDQKGGPSWVGRYATAAMYRALESIDLLSKKQVSKIDF